MHWYLYGNQGIKHLNNQSTHRSKFLLLLGPWSYGTCLCTQPYTLLQLEWHVCTITYPPCWYNFVSESAPCPSLSVIKPLDQCAPVQSRRWFLIKRRSCLTKFSFLCLQIEFHYLQQNYYFHRQRKSFPVTACCGLSSGFLICMHHINWHSLIIRDTSIISPFYPKPNPFRGRQHLDITL